MTSKNLRSTFEKLELSPVRNQTIFRFFFEKQWKNSSASKKRKPDRMQTIPVQRKILNLCTFSRFARNENIQSFPYCRFSSIFVWLLNFARHKICFAESTIRRLFRNCSHVQHLIAVCQQFLLFFSVERSAQVCSIYICVILSKLLTTPYSECTFNSRWNFMEI